MSDRETVKDLARWVLSLQAGNLSSAVIAQARLLVLDTVGCALGTLDEPEAIEAVRAVATLGGSRQCTVIGSKLKTSAHNAVLANGILVRFLDLNDYTIGRGREGPTVGGHPSDNIAVALAMGEWRKRSGKDVIAAIVTGYELYSRLAALYDQGGTWDLTSVSGLVSAAIAGRLLGLDAERMANALALGAARAMTPAIVRFGHITAAKFLTNPLIAQSGVTAAVLAAGGMSGPQAVLDDRRGIRALFKGDADPASLAAPWAGEFAILRSNVKAYPCLATGQAAVAAAIDLHRRLAGRIEQIERIDVIMTDHPFVKAQQEDEDRRHPDSREAADHSFYFLVAVALLDGQLGSRQFDNERWRDPALTGLMAKITMVSDPTWRKRAPDGYPCTVKVSMGDGTEHKSDVAYAPGFSKGGLDRATVEAKFDAITDGVLSAPQKKKLKTTVARLEKLSTIDPVMSLLKGKARRAKAKR